MGFGQGILNLLYGRDVHHHGVFNDLAIRPKDDLLMMLIPALVHVVVMFVDNNFAGWLPLTGDQELELAMGTGALTLVEQLPATGIGVIAGNAVALGHKGVEINQTIAGRIHRVDSER